MTKWRRCAEELPPMDGFGHTSQTVLSWPNHGLVYMDKLGWHADNGPWMGVDAEDAGITHWAYYPEGPED